MKAVSYVLVYAVFALLAQQQLKADSSVLKRLYREGETLHYQMNARNQDGSKTTAYQAEADGVVHRNAAGIFIEEFRWSHLGFDGSAFPLSTASLNFRQELSLDPAFRLSIPDLNKVQPALIGPIVDLLTFYADTQLAMRQSGVRHQGDHVYVKHGRPNSWADHVHTTVGEDAIDFEIMLKSLDIPGNSATLVVKHVPPAAPQIKIPANWMRAPVADMPNNWVQVRKEGEKYVASVGQETFTDTVHVSLRDGRIASATMENPVEVREENCSDAGLQNCGSARRYRIERHVEIHSDMK